MGIASFSRSPVLTVLLAPLQALVALFVPDQSASAGNQMPTHLPKHPLPGSTALATKTVALNALSTRTEGQKSCQTVAKAASPRRLKIVREFEAGISPACAGRMVISGRMADVCAELDRMAQREAARPTA